MKEKERQSNKICDHFGGVFIVSVSKNIVKFFVSKS